jgi:hypothetical protein
MREKAQRKLKAGLKVAGAEMSTANEHSGEPFHGWQTSSA